MPTVFVLHANHPNELNDEVRAACQKLRASGVTLLNQSVLLRGVNAAAPQLLDADVSLSGVDFGFRGGTLTVSGAGSSEALSIRHEGTAAEPLTTRRNGS